MTTQTPGGRTPDSTGLVARLRAEHAAHTDRGLQALLLHECGVLEEALGEEPVAARDFLASYNADAQFREPLEALVRILTRRKSVKNLGKLLEALTRSAETGDERARALWERSAFQQDHESNLAGAKQSLEAAVVDHHADATLWLELELIAAKEGDAAGRMRALEARAELATDPTWKALLFVDLAELSAAGGEPARAYELLGAAAALDGQARFRSQIVLEILAARDGNLDALTQALEGQAELIEEAIEDGERGNANGVPLFLRANEHAADAWFRAAELKRGLGDAAGGARLLERAAARLPGSPVIARARLLALEAAGDPMGAASLARAELDLGVSGGGAAALWLRLAQAAALAGDRPAALSSLRSALEADPGSVPARALELDTLGDGKDPVALATALEGTAEVLPEGEGKGRAFLLAAYVWALGARDVPAAKAALAQAVASGVAPGTAARFARTLASLAGELAWYEDATKHLVVVGAEPGELPSLWFELGRSKLLRGHAEGAAAAFAKLATCDATEDGPGPSAWLGRVLGAYTVDPSAPAASDEAGRDSTPAAREPGEPSSGGGGKPSTGLAPDTIEALARVESDPALARGFWLIGALRALRSGDLERARARLRELHAEAVGDEVVAVFLAELERVAGRVPEAAAVLSACADRSDDPDLTAALHLEAAMLLWRAGDRTGGIAELEAARVGSPRAAAPVLAWALRGTDPDRPEVRRRALALAIEAATPGGGESTGLELERFGLELLGGDPAAALAALEAVEDEGTGDLAVAAALGRLLWGPALEQRREVDRALQRLEELGGDARALSRAERFRQARVVDRDRVLSTARAASWESAEPTLPVALEWLGAAEAAEDRDAEIAARSAAARHFQGSGAAAMNASAAVVAMLDRPHGLHPLVRGTEAPAQLANLELSPPGCDPRRRAAALHGLGTALGAEAQLDAIALAGWSDLAAESYDAARSAFQTVLEVRADDVACWEGVRAASEALGDHVATALAAAQLGSLCRDGRRGAAFWETAGRILLERTAAHDDAEIAFARAFERDPRRGFAFDKLFRRVRDRNENDRLLEIISQRLEVSDDDTEIGKLYWERARVMRKKGNVDGALEALETVMMLEPDHVGALALSGEICITKGAFAEAAPILARLSTVQEAPTQQRLMSGVAAVDLYENKLGQPDKALEVLVGLHRAGLSTVQVRERLARVAARAGAWTEATSILESLMVERDKREGRIEAARLAMVIWRDKAKQPARAQAAVSKLLGEVPDDVEAVDLVIGTTFDEPFRSHAIERAKATLLQALAADPCQPDRVALLARIAKRNQDAPLRQATLGALVALGRDEGYSEELAALDRRVAGRPQVVLDERALAEIADPDDNGPVAELFRQIGETACLALGPSLAALQVTRKERVDARGGHPLRLVVAEWMGAVGLSGDFELYLGGPDPRAVRAVATELPAIVLGGGLTPPLDAAARSALAREVFALRRGTGALTTRDDNSIASLVVALCGEAGLAVPQPPYAVFGEVARAVHKEISRKVRKGIVEVCQRVIVSEQDARLWATAARRSLDRVAVLAAADASVVLSQVLGVPRAELGAHVPKSERARRLLAFVLSPSYLALRQKLGMGVQ